MNFEPLLKFGVDQGASAIHLQSGSAPQLRIGGQIRGVESAPIQPADLKTFVALIAPKAVTDYLERSISQGAAFSTSRSAAGRFRCALFSRLGEPGMVLRVIPAAIPSLEELHLPPVVRQVALAKRGLVLVAGPSGSGKTTTLNAMIDVVNSATTQKMVTIEEPVEFLHTNKKSLITQMEVGLDATSFEHGLRLALRQDADVIVIGELRDAPTMRLALEAAEGGKKIFAAVPGLFAIQLLERIIGAVPADERGAVGAQVGSALEAVIAQRLAATRDGKLLPALEVLRGGANTARYIAENRLKDLRFHMEGRQGGMQTLDQSLIDLHQSGGISGTETMRLASNPEEVAAGLRALREAGTEGELKP
jgi:twitching motility protein PilT